MRPAAAKISAIILSGDVTSNVRVRHEQRWRWGSRTVKANPTVEGVVLWEVESVVESCSSHPQRASRKNPLRNISGSIGIPTRADRERTRRT